MFSINPNSDLSVRGVARSLARRADLILLLLVVVFVYLHVFRPPFTPFFYEADHLIFLYDADRMVRGDVIYRDFFQFTFPGTQVLYFLLFKIFGPEYFVLGLFVIGVGAALFWTGLMVSRQVIDGPLAYLPPVIFVFFGMRWFGMDGSHRMLGPIFIVLAVWALMRGTTLRNSALAGVFCALASFITQPRGVYALAGCCIFIAVRFLARREDLISSAKMIAAAGAGFSITLLVLCSYFIITAGPEVFIESTILHPMKYYGLHPENTSNVYFVELAKAFDISSAQQILPAASALMHAVLLPLAPIIFLVGFALYRPRDWARWEKPLFLAIMAAVLYLGVAAPMHLRLFSVSMPALILAVWMLANLDIVNRFQRALSVFSISALVILGFFIVITWHFRVNVSTAELPAGTVAIVEPNEQFKRYLWLRDRTAPGDYVYEVYEPYINFPLQVLNPTRIGQVFAYGYTPTHQVESVIADLRERQPEFIIWDNSYNVADGERRPDDPTGPLSEYVMRNYAPEGDIYLIGGKPIQIWKRRPE